MANPLHNHKVVQLPLLQTLSLPCPRRWETERSVRKQWNENNTKI